MSTAEYLIIADETPEFHVALRYAARVSKDHGVKLRVLYVMEPEEIQAFGGLQERIHADLKSDAQEIVNNAAQYIQVETGNAPEQCIVEGGRLEAVSEYIEKNPVITKLILAASSETSSPGPLVSYFTGKGMMALHVPLTIVPEHLSQFAGGK